MRDGKAIACEMFPEREDALAAVGLPKVGDTTMRARLQSGPPLDLVLVDGGHGFPTPILDWYYGAGRLRQGGVVIVDDLQLRQVRLGLMEFLDADLRWERVESTGKWAAYRRLTTGNLREEWRDQAFLDAL
jgi:hypothetical protein